jgi:hypothetical protein
MRWRTQSLRCNLSRLSQWCECIVLNVQLFLCGAIQSLLFRLQALFFLAVAWVAQTTLAISMSPDTLSPAIVLDEVAT